jgi:photosystem II stability/assembly factor-like uncharacterized protein
MDARTHLLLGAAAACLLLSSAATPALAQGAPGSSSSWTGGGPDLGFVNAIRRASPGGPVYAGTYGGGIFRSDDGGLSWSDFSFGTVDDAIVLEIETATRGAEELVYIATENSGLWRWRSGIGLWEGLNSGMGGQGPLGVRGLAIHPNDPKVLTVATTAGIFTSNDGGRTWPDSLRWLEGSTFEDVAVSPRAPNTIFGLESFSLFETQDKGDHLIDLGAGLPFHFNWDFEFHRDSLDSLLVLTLDDGLYLSTQRDPFARIGPTQNQAAGIRSYDLEITRRDGALLVGSERGLHVSQDMGQSWLKHNAYQETIALPEIWAIWIEAERPLELFLGSFRSGFMRTGLGLDDWQESNQGLRAAWIEGLHAWEGNVVATTAHGRVFHSTDFAQSWVERTGDLDAIRQNDFHRFPGGERWLLASVSGVWLSDDLGQHWRLPAVPVAESCRRFLHPAWEPEGTLYVTTFKGVWKAVDAGETWLRVGEGLPAAGNFQAAGAASGDQTVFFGALGDAIYRSVAGSPFQALPNSAFGSRRYRDFAFPRGDGSLVAVASSGSLDLWQITPDGSVPVRMDMKSGLPRAPNMGGPDVETILHDPAEDIFYAGLAEDGVWQSKNSGNSWERFDEGIRVPRIEALEFVADERRLYVGTAGSGVYARALDTEVGLPEGDPPPAETPDELAAGYLRLRPLSASPLREGEAHFELALGRALRPAVNIYDMRGRLVRDLTPGLLGVGKHELRWDLRDRHGSSVANGVYWIRAESGGRVVHERLVLAR